MKTLAISAFGWSEAECEAFEQYVRDLGDDFYTNVSIVYTTDHFFEIDIEEDDVAVEYLILRATAEA